jgi:C4-dicarboxylate transporter DctQ subunit
VLRLARFDASKRTAAAAQRTAGGEDRSIMTSGINGAIGWMRRRAENVVAGLLGIMFVAFLVQIVFRYVFNFPIGWTSELSVVAWLYMTLLGSAFWLKESEEIRFDLLSGRLGPRGRRVLAFLVAVAAVVLFGMSLPAAYKYVTFMKVESSSYLKIRLDILYSVYLVFAVGVVVRYAWAIVTLVRGEAPEEADITKTSSGL